MIFLCRVFLVSLSLSVMDIFAKQFGYGAWDSGPRGYLLLAVRIAIFNHITFILAVATYVTSITFTFIWSTSTSTFTMPVTRFLSITKTITINIITTAEIILITDTYCIDTCCVNVTVTMIATSHRSVAFKLT